MMKRTWVFPPPIRQALGCGVVLIGLCNSAWCETPDNIRVTTFLTLFAAKTDLATLKNHYNLCRQANGLPPGLFPKSLTENIIKEKNGTRVIKMYSGLAQAELTEESLFTVDMSNGCHVVQQSSFRASVQLDCEIHWEGSSSQTSPAQVLITASKTEACIRDKASSASRDILKSAKATQVDGTPCLISQALQHSNISYCLYGKTPFYMGNPARMVSFESGKVIDRSIVAMESTLEELKDGGFTFPKNQFTKQTVTDWVNQPVVREFK